MTMVTVQALKSFLAIEAEKCAELADRLRERCVRCSADLERDDEAGTAWHEGYRFALAELARRIRNSEFD